MFDSSCTDLSSDEANKVNNLKPHLCNIPGCSAAFSKQKKLIYHLRLHAGERPYKCDFEGCSKNYTNSAHLLRHKRCHQGQKKVKCSLPGCELMLTESNLKRHINRMHNPHRKFPFTCEICGQGYFKKQQLQRHIAIHSGLLPYLCTECGQRFISLRELNRHKRNHRTYSCICNETFQKFHELVAHMKTCEQSKPKCEICKKKFKSKSNLQQHLQIHLDDTEKIAFQCTWEGCDRFYHHKKNLDYHVKTYHEGIQKPKILCPKGCGKELSQNQKLKFHLRKHEDNKESSMSQEKHKNKERRDKGVPKICQASIISGVPLPREINKQIILGEIQELASQFPSLNSDHNTGSDNLTGKSEVYKIDAVMVPPTGLPLVPF